MKLISFLVGTPLGKFERIGCLLREQVVDLNMAYAAFLYKVERIPKPYQNASLLIPPDMVGFFDGAPASMSVARKTIEFVTNELEQEGDIKGPNEEKVIYNENEIKYLAPFPRPNSIRDFFTFETHAKHSFEKQGRAFPREWYEFPMYFKLNHSATIGHEEEIIWPEYSEKLDYELEVGIYIGRRGKDIPKQKALDYIAGYTIFNDVSARDQQAREIIFAVGPAKGKDFDHSKIMGPCLVTPDEIADSKNLKMIARINGEVWSEGNTSDMYHSFEDLVEHTSKSQTLQIGDFFGSGCVGDGCGLELDRWVKPGDMVELEIEGIGILRNRVGEKLSKRRGG